MVDLSLDLDPTSPTYKDLLILNGDLVLTSDADPAGTDPVLQNVLQNLSFFFQEWFMDNTKGVPWIQRIFLKGAKQSDIDAILKNVIVNTPGIQRLTFYSFTLSSSLRGGAIQFRAQKSDGTINYSGTLTGQGAA